MKKVLLGISTALLTVLLCFTMAGCDKSGSVKKALENEGFTVTEMTTKDNEDAEKLLSILLTKDQIEQVGKYSVLLCSEKVAVVNIPVAAVIKFSSSSEMKDFLTVEDSDGKKDTSAYDKAKEKGWINGNCLILTASPKALSAFKNA